MQEAREDTAKLLNAGTEQLVDITDNATSAALVALHETHKSLHQTAQSGLTVEGKSVEAAFEESEKLRKQYVDSLRNIKSALLKIVQGS